MAELYTQEEIDALEMHIDTYFGSYDRVFHELVSPDIHVDICIIPPSEERPYYTLVTQGMGAHCMNVPQELADYKLERAELMIALPPDWLVGNEEEKWYWPIRSLKAAARMVIEQNTWLGWGTVFPCLTVKRTGEWPFPVCWCFLPLRRKRDLVSALCRMAARSTFTRYCPCMLKNWPANAATMLKHC